jgi:hypothetical protein
MDDKQPLARAQAIAFCKDRRPWAGVRCIPARDKEPIKPCSQTSQTADA